MNGISKRTSAREKAGVRLLIAGAGAAGILLGFGAGMIVTNLRQEEPRVGSAIRQSSRDTEISSRFPDGNSTRGGPSRPPARANPPALTSIPDPGILVDLVRTTQVSLEERSTLFSDGDPLAAALGMTPDEVSALEHEWARVKDAVIRLQRKSLQHQTDGNRLWIGAAPFDGASLEDGFREAAAMTLGSERAEAFLEITRATDAFGRWGRTPSATYSIEYERQSDGSLVFRITEKAAPDAPAGRTWISNRIPPHIRDLTDGLGIDPEAPGS